MATLLRWLELRALPSNGGAAARAPGARRRGPLRSRRCEPGRVPLRKAWRIQCSRPDAPAALQVRCPGDHRHGRIEGAETTGTGFYTKEAAKHFLKGIFVFNTGIDSSPGKAAGQTITGALDAGRRAGQTITEALDAGRGLREALPADRLRRPLRRGDGGAAAAAEGAAAAADPERYSVALRAAVHKLHSQHGHPELQALARAVRLVGGTDEAVACALHFRCSVCVWLHEPGPAMPSSLSDTAKQFGDLVALDTLTLADHNGNIVLFLNMIDVATRFGIVSKLSSRHLLVVWLNFQRSWASWGGFPRRLLVDSGGEFEREFRQEAEAIPMEVSTIAAYSPTQNSVAERRGGAWKAVARSLIDDYSVSFLNELRTEWLISAVNWAMNSQVSRSGYSPSQWVLGRSIRLPFDLLARPRQLSMHLRARTDPTFADRIALLRAAQRAASGLRYTRGLGRAFLARSRVHDAATAQHQFSLGDQVYYWRGRGRAKRDWAARWHGPGIVIGYRANNFWLTHRDTTVKCATRHVRLAEQEERLPWDQVFQQAFAEQQPNDADMPDFPPARPSRYRRGSLALGEHVLARTSSSTSPRTRGPATLPASAAASTPPRRLPHSRSTRPRRRLAPPLQICIPPVRQRRRRCPAR